MESIEKGAGAQNMAVCLWTCAVMCWVGLSQKKPSNTSSGRPHLEKHVLLNLTFFIGALSCYIVKAKTNTSPVSMNGKYYINMKPRIFLLETSADKTY